jgi:hypothetical protein
MQIRCLIHREIAPIQMKGCTKSVHQRSCLKLCTLTPTICQCCHLHLHLATTTAVQRIASVPEIMDTHRIASLFKNVYCYENGYKSQCLGKRKTIEAALVKWSTCKITWLWNVPVLIDTARASWVVKGVSINYFELLKETQKLHLTARRYKISLKYFWAEKT